MFLSGLGAQSITEPCARLALGLGQDSLGWVGQPCAGFGGYVVLGSQQSGGTLLPLDTVSASPFAHNNPSETPWYYQIAMLCNGALVGHTPVFSNQRPVCPNLRNVSIIGGVPVVSWYASPSPEVIGYQIYKEQPYDSGNFFPYPAAGVLVSGLSFTDAAATDLLARYAIVAVSPCNKSLLGEGTALDGTTGPHTSMVVQGRLDSCARRYYLTWNAYRNWEQGAQHYEIWLSRNGQAAQPIDTAFTTSYVYNNAQDGDQLVFYIRAAEVGMPGNYALSNTLSVDVAVNRPMDFLRMTELSVTPDNTGIDLEWHWDTDTDFAGGALQIADNPNNGTWSDLATFSSLPATVMPWNAPADVERRLYYRVQTADACGNERRSNFMSNTVLSGIPLPDYQNHLTWKPAHMQYAQIESQRLVRIVGADESTVGLFVPGDSTALHAVQIASEAEAKTCYYLITTLLVEYPDGIQRRIESRSNTVCVQQDAIAYFPNALVPDGANRLFRPVLVFGKSITAYTLRIFDRYGGLVFAATDPYAAWDGSRPDGEPAEQGVYVYIAEFMQPTGNKAVYKGTVLVLR